MEKLMMSRPSDFRRLAFSAISMIALGLARPMRLANWGMRDLVGKDAWRNYLLLAVQAARIMPPCSRSNPPRGRTWPPARRRRRPHSARCGRGEWKGVRRGRGGEVGGG